MPVLKTIPSTALVLTGDASLVRSLEDVLPRLRLRPVFCADWEELRPLLERERADALIVDLDLGHAAACEAIQGVRDGLCSDWLPIVLLQSSPEAGQAVAGRLPGTVDFCIDKAGVAAGLREHRVALRRMIALRRVTRSALDRVSEAVIVIDERGIVRSFNGAAESLFGWRADEILGCNVSRLVPGAHRQQHDRYLQDYRRTGVAKIVGIGRVEKAARRDGSEFPMHLTVADISDGTSRRYVGVIRDLTALHERRELVQMIHVDTLTGLPNRAGAQKALADAMARRAEGGDSFSLLFCDVDRFKHINDTYGHRVGDEVLTTVATRLRRAVQARDLVARFAGDEFLVVLQGVGDSHLAAHIATRVSQAASGPVHLGELEIPVSLSVGAATAADGRSVADLFDLADKRMYEHKRARRERWVAG